MSHLLCSLSPLFELEPAVAGVLGYNLRIWTLPATRPTNATVTLPAISRSYRAPTSFLSSSHIFWQIEYLLATGSLLGPLLDFYTLDLPNLAILSLAAPELSIHRLAAACRLDCEKRGLGCHRTVHCHLRGSLVYKRSDPELCGAAGTPRHLLVTVPNSKPPTYS